MLGGVSAVDTGGGQLEDNLFFVEIGNECCPRLIVKSLEGGLESSQHEYFVWLLVREEDLVAVLGRHCFDVNVICVKVIQDKHAGISGINWHRKRPVWSVKTQPVTYIDWA